MAAASGESLFGSLGLGIRPLDFYEIRYGLKEYTGHHFTLNSVNSSTELE